MRGVAQYLEAGQWHLDQLPLDFALERLEPRGLRSASLPEGSEGIGSVHSTVALDEPHDLGLSSRVLDEDGRPPSRHKGAHLAPVDLDDLASDLVRREHLGRRARAFGVLEAPVEERQEDGVLVGGGVAALLEQLEDLRLSSGRSTVRMFSRHKPRPLQ